MITFAKLRTYRAALAGLKSRLGLTLTNGEKSDLAGNAGSALLFQPQAATPWSGSAFGAEGIHLEAGMLTYGSRTLYYPAADYSGTAPGGVFLKVTADFEASANAPGDPWDVYIDDSTAPVPEWHILNTTGTHCRVEDTDLTSSETVVVTPGVVYFPLAFQFGGKIVSLFTGHLALTFNGAGRALLTQSFGTV